MRLFIVGFFDGFFRVYTDPVLIKFSRSYRRGHALGWKLGGGA